MSSGALFKNGKRGPRGQNSHFWLQKFWNICARSGPPQLGVVLVLHFDAHMHTGNLFTCSDCGLVSWPHKHIVGQKSNDTSIHSWLPFNEKSTPGKNKDIQVYIRMSTKTDIDLRMVTLMSTQKTRTENGHPPVFRFSRFVVM